MSPLTPGPAGPVRLPRAGVDPIRHEGPALALVRAVVAHPVRAETIVVTLDRERRGLGLVVVNGTTHPDDVVVVASRVLDAAARVTDAAYAVVASVRPGPCDLDLSDAERWLELDLVASACGVEVVEWFVLEPDPVGLRVNRPRQLVNAPSRWPRDVHDAAWR